jgi:hypothetical protein
MAPKKPDNGSRPNRIRFVVLEADIRDGNLSELTQAITSALRPSSAGVRQIPARAAIPAILPPEEAPTTLEESDDVVETVAEEPSDESPKTPKTKYKPPLPTYLANLDLKGGGGGPSFKDYAEESNPASHARRYLVAALWLKEYGNSPTITVDKLYTCYKTAGWPLSITDWDVNFRNQVKTDKFRRVSPGEYAITPLGEDELRSS